MSVHYFRLSATVSTFRLHEQFNGLYSARVRDYASVVALAVFLHAGFGLAWLMQPTEPTLGLNEMTVSVVLRQADVLQEPISPKPPPLEPQLKAVQDELAVSNELEKIVETSPDTPVVEEALMQARAQEEDTEPDYRTDYFDNLRPTYPKELEKIVEIPSVTPTVKEAFTQASAQEEDTEPDYRADYLNNSRPTYPMVARRMGYHGKVLLNVEVKAEGNVGEIMIYASSGYKVLDDSALLAVKSWHFSPARQAGRVITKWFIVPINFTLGG